MRGLRRLGALAGCAVIAAGLGAGAAPAGAATYPPPVSNIRAVVTDHQAVVTFDVPAAYYSPGARGVVVMTIGHTPAPTTTRGYRVPVTGRTATRALLSDRSAYTFAIWVYAGGQYSARRSITVTTLRDVTPPHPLAAVTALAGTAIGGYGNCEPTVSLHFVPSVPDADVSYLRVVRNTRYITTGGLVFDVLAGVGHTDSRQLHPGTRYYYWVVPVDLAGHVAAYYVGVNVVTTGTPPSPSAPMGVCRAS